MLLKHKNLRLINKYITQKEQGYPALFVLTFDTFVDTYGHLLYSKSILKFRGLYMSKLIEQVKHTIDVTSPDADELIHSTHRKLDYLMLLARNLMVGAAALLFIGSFFFDEIYNILKAIAYFCGAIAYLLELLLLTDCFKTKVPHKEMFMVYCLGPLYLLMGLNYILH